MYDLRKGIPVHRMGFIITDISQHLVGILNNRRTLIRADRRNLLDHIRYQIGVPDHNFIRFFRTKVGKFIQHFLRCTKV